MSLFRKEVLERQNRYYGDILIALPVSLSILSFGAVIIILFLIVFMTLGEFTKKEKIGGVLLPYDGIVDVYAGKKGVIIKSFVSEGDDVKKGQSLYLVSSDTTSQGDVYLRRKMNDILNNRISSMKDRVLIFNDLLIKRKENIKNDIFGLRNELKSANELLIIKTRELDLAKLSFNAYKKGYDKKLISNIKIFEQENNVLLQKSSLISLKDKINSIELEINKKSDSKEEISLENSIEISQINNVLSVLEQEKLSNESQREYKIISPVNGVVSAINMKIGDTTVANENPLLSVVPNDQELYAHLYVPSRSIGFIHEDQVVFLRYQAFPYQKFGQYKGYIKQISGTPVSTDVIPYQLDKKATQDKYVYRVKVSLERNTIDAYGKLKLLKPGMKLEASIAVESRYLYEWLIEPLNEVIDHMNPKEIIL